MQDESEGSADRRLVLAALIGATAVARDAGFASAQAFTGPGTSVRQPEDFTWSTPAGAPPRSIESVMLTGDPELTGPYVTLIRWYPGWMSAPHRYLTDRMGVVLSGLWWIDSASDFDPKRCRSVGPGAYVQREAGTAHYDGVVSGASRPAVIAIFGIAPVKLTFIDPTKPGIRRA